MLSYFGTKLIVSHLNFHITLFQNLFFYTYHLDLNNFSTYYSKLIDLYIPFKPLSLSQVPGIHCSNIFPLKLYIHLIVQKYYRQLFKKPFFPTIHSISIHYTFLNEIMGIHTNHTSLNVSSPVHVNPSTQLYQIQTQLVLQNSFDTLTISWLKGHYWLFIGPTFMLYHSTHNFLLFMLIDSH